MKTKTMKTLDALMILAVSMVVFVPQAVDAGDWSDFWNWLSGGFSSSETCPYCGATVSEDGAHYTTCANRDI